MKMEQILKEIAQNTSQKESFYMNISDYKTHIITSFRPALQLNPNRRYAMALVGLETYYSVPNIDASNNVFRYSHNDGANWFDILLPEGSYEFSDINNYISMIMEENGHYDTVNGVAEIVLAPNNNTLKSVLKIAQHYKVDFTIEHSLRTVLGFDSEIYSSGTHQSENVVNIFNVNSFVVTSSIIQSSYTNGSKGNAIYNFFPDVSPGYKIIETPQYLIYLPLSTSIIDEMATRLTDQTGKILNLRG